MTDRKHSLPYNVRLGEMIVLLEEVKNRPSATENDVRMRVKNYERTKSALVELSLILIDGSSLRLTDVGKKLIWETDEKKKKEILLVDVVARYVPYEVVLTHALRDLGDTIESDYVQGIWGHQLGIQLSVRARAAAVATFFQLLDYAEVGNHLIGRHGKPTRLEKIDRANLRAVLEEARKPVQGDGMILESFMPPRSQRHEIKEPQSPEHMMPPVPPSKKLHFKVEPHFDLHIEETKEAFSSLEALLPVYKQVFGIGLVKKSKKAEKEPPVG
jgi:hypothetical protein